MNGYFKKPALIVLLVLLAIFFVYVFSRYAVLAFTPVSKIQVPYEQAERGSIVDRRGKPLAVQTNFYHVGVTPHLVKNKEQFAHDVSVPLDMDEKIILRILENNSESSFVYLKKKVNQNVYANLKEIADKNKYTYISFDRIPGRVYPENSLASQLIGYMGDDGKGLAGVEYSMQSYLQPTEQEGTASASGKNVYLTIDANLQYKLEQIANQTMDSTHAESMILLAADAKTGEILSYISLPSVNLNEYGMASIAETIDRPAMVAYEPGSVFKIFTIAMAYDNSLIKAGDSFFCNGLYEKKYPGETVRIKCLGTHGWLTPRDALKFSCNDVIAQISDRMNEDDFIAGIKRLGFGKRTEINLPGETYGLVKTPGSKTWSGRSKPTISMGQEISVSALQMVQAASAIANKGIPLKLSVIKKITNKDGSIVYEHQPTEKERVFKEATAKYVLSCMETTAISGTGSRARLNDISIGVKTGTAQMADRENDGYSSTDFLSNCIAIFPIENPEIILYIVVSKAQGETYAGRIVAPVIAKTADEIIDYLGMSRGQAESLEHSGKISITPSRGVEIGKYVPDFSGLPKKSLAGLLKRNDIQVKINGSGWVKSQSPAPGTPVTENMVIEINLE